MTILGSRLSRGQAAMVLGALAYLFVYTLLFAVWRSLPRVYDHWSVGDWLINYHGGFVRRGLSGWLIIGVSDSFGLRYESVIVALKFLFYGLVYGFSALLIFRPKPAPLLLVLALLSPLVLQFPVFSNYGGGRKEIIALAWAAIIAWRASQGLGRPGKTGLALFFLLLTAIHDGLFFFIPMFVVFVNMLFPDDALEISDMAAISLPSMIFMAFVVLKGPVEQSQVLAIIEGFRGDPRYWNDGGIAVLTKGFRDGLGAALGSATRERLVLVAGSTALASLPLVLWQWINEGKYPWASSSWRSFRGHRPWLLVILSQVPLFAVAGDWARWLMIDFTVLSLALLGSFRRRERLREKVPPPLTAPWPLFLVASIFYLATWRLHFITGELMRQSWGNHIKDVMTLLMNIGVID